MLKFSANLGFLWPELPLLKRIEAAHRAGFKAVELHWPYDIPASEVRDICKLHSIELLALNTPTGNPEAYEFGLAALSGREEDFRRSFQQAASYARVAGASAVHVMAGVVSHSQRSQAKAVLINNLRYAAAQAPDLILLLEPINQRDKPDYFYSTVEDCSEIIEAVGAANVKILFDVYHIGVSQGDILRRLQVYFALIGHIQIAAVPSRHEPDEGEVAYSAIFAAIDALGYQGWIGCEYKPRATTEAGLGWVNYLRRGDYAE